MSSSNRATRCLILPAALAVALAAPAVAHISDECAPQAADYTNATLRALNVADRALKRLVAFPSEGVTFADHVKTVNVLTAAILEKHDADERLLRCIEGQAR